MLANRHPVDRLADLRVAIKALKAEEDEIRKSLLAEGADLSGSEHYARITLTEQSKLDRKVLEERYGAKEVAECSKPVQVVTIRTVARFADCEGEE
ncbi:hypothetical protein [Kaistia granuli]|uniref:hypothetical protein n=1 Tax=Kaistia granuli TaxID=363259 RepID=UPI0003751BCC|nr:hypothetical protein [Kaistia granuli]